MAQAQLRPESADSPDAERAMPRAPLRPVEETVIEPHGSWPTLGLGDLWRYRDLIFQLTLRNIKVRYKQTVLGVAWAVLQPVLWMVVFWVMFAGGSRSGGDVPYPIFVFSGLLPWLFFQTAVTTAANSVVSSEGLVTKVYFPRLAIPLSAIAAALVDLAVSFIVLVGLMLWYRVVPTASLLLLPAAVVLLMLAAIGIGTAIAALTVSYRDFRHTIGFLLQIWMLLTATIYSPAQGAATTNTTGIAAINAAESARPTGPFGDANSLPTNSRSTAYKWAGWLAQNNPMSTPIEFFRAATLGRPIAWGSVLGWGAFHFLVCLAGMIYFRRVEDSFADVI